MAKKETSAPVTGAETEGTEKKSRAGTCPSGFYIYIGPNIKKYIQTGTVYRGTRAQALTKAAEAIKAQPLVKTLIVSGDNLGQNLQRVKTPGNVLYASYQKLAGKEGK